LRFANIVMYETKRNSRRTSAAKISSHRPAEGRLRRMRNRQDTGGNPRGGNTVASSLPSPGAKCAESQAALGPTAKAVGKTTSKTSAPVIGRAVSKRLSNRVVDAETHCRGNPAGIRCLLRPIGRLAHFEGDGLELPEAGASGQRTRRTVSKTNAKRTSGIPSVP